VYELNDPGLAAVAERTRVLLIGMRGARSLSNLARGLGVAEDALSAFLESGATKRVEPRFLVSVIVGLIRDERADPEWLFAERYSSLEESSERKSLNTMPDLRAYVEQRLARLTQSPAESNDRPREPL
jgi:hypothetical protein